MIEFVRGYDFDHPIKHSRPEDLVYLVIFEEV